MHMCINLTVTEASKYYSHAEYLWFFFGAYSKVMSNIFYFDPTYLCWQNWYMNRIRIHLIPCGKAFAAVLYIHIYYSHIYM